MNDPKTVALAQALSNILKNQPRIVINNVLDAIANAVPSTSVINWNNLNAANRTAEELGEDLFHELDHLYWDAPREDGSAPPLPPIDPANPKITVYGEGGYTMTIDRSLGITGYEHLLVHDSIFAVYGNDLTAALTEAFMAEETTITKDGRTLSAAEKAEFLDDFLAENNGKSLGFSGAPDFNAIKAVILAHGGSCPVSTSQAETSLVQTYESYEYHWTGAR